MRYNSGMINIVQQSRQWMPAKLLMVLLLMTATASHVAQARPELGPPSIKLRSNIANVVVATLAGETDEGRMAFDKVSDLHNEAPQRIVIDGAEHWRDQLMVGKTYVLGFISWQRQRHPKVLKPRPGGPVLMNLPGASPAIYQDHPGVRRLLSWPLDEAQYSPEAMLPVIMSGLDSGDWQLQEFFLTELVTREPLHAHLTPEQRQRVAAMAADASVSPEARQLLLDLGDFLGEALTAQQRLGIARELIASQPLIQDPASDYPSLVRTALFTLEQQGDPTDVPVLSRWLRCEHTGLVEAALDAMQALDVVQLPGIISRQLDDTLISQPRRQALQSYQRRVAAILRQRQNEESGREG
ncbi:MAG: hypothetical protein Tsb002_33410 [Wenzhouxiangellaceae bacterium]